MFEEPTKLFSQSQVPLIAEVLPMLDSIEQSMNLVCDDEESKLPNVVCVAAQAILILINKYYTLMKETELYVIAIGKYGICYLFLGADTQQSCVLIRSSNGSRIMVTQLHKYEISRRWFSLIGMSHIREMRKFYLLPLQCPREPR